MVRFSSLLLLPPFSVPSPIGTSAVARRFKYVFSQTSLCCSSFDHRSRLKLRPLVFQFLNADVLFQNHRCLRLVRRQRLRQVVLHQHKPQRAPHPKATQIFVRCSLAVRNSNVLCMPETTDRSRRLEYKPAVSKRLGT